MLEIYPAIDLKDGKAVRLFKGAMESAKVYGDALEFAKIFESYGARWLHIVDLDGAVEGSPRNAKIIESIATHTSLQVQVGGGIRDESRVRFYLNIGIKRAILGSIAVSNTALACELARRYPIAIGIDARNGKIATHGWKQESALDCYAFAKSLRGSAVEAIICTDITRDGALSGINTHFTQEIATHSGIYTIASGGFASEAELAPLSENPHIRGVIIGRAYYEGQINLKEVLKLYAD